MSLMAGYDFVLEISNAALLKLIMSNKDFGGLTGSPPFEVSVPISASGTTSSAHIIVDKMVLDLNANDTATFTLSFSKSSVIVTSPLPLTMSGLDGDVKVTVPIQLTSVPKATNMQAVAVDLTNATVSITFSQNAQSKISSALSGSIITPQMFYTLANNALSSYVKKNGKVQFPLKFKVVAGKEGAISSSLQFEKLEVHCIPNADKAKQAVGLFGIFILANHAKGSHTQRTASAIPSSSDICISISPEAFHKKILCPVVAEKLLKTEYAQDSAAAIAKLPTTCGSGGSLSYKGVNLTSITSSFSNGKIDVNAIAKKSGFCYEATGSMHGSITPVMNGSTLKPKLTLDQPDIDIDIPWYCYLAAGGIGLAIGGAIGAVIGVTTAGLADAIADTIASSLVGDIGLSSIQPKSQSLSVISGATFNSVSVTTEGLTVGGYLSIKLPAAASPSVALKGSVVTKSFKVLSKGTFHNTFCLEGDFPYTEKAQNQLGTYKVIATLLGRPLKLTWQIKAGSVGPLGVPTSQSDPVTITGSSGTLTIPKVSVHFPFPLPSGTMVTQDVHIGYQISGDVIKLTNVPKEGNYYFWLEARAEDPSGQVYKATAKGQFEGDYAEIGGGYHEKMADCLDKLNTKLKILTFQANEHLTRYGFPPVDYPAPDVILGFIDSITESEVSEADDILAHTRLLHSSSFYKAFASEQAVDKALGLIEVDLDFKL